MKPKPIGRRKIDLWLAATAVVSACLNLYGIWRDTTANAYYTAAVASMLQSWHNFFYASFDPGGFVTVDKPPVAFWIQTASAWLFGLHGWSVILPQALAVIGAVLLAYALVKPTYGVASARIAAVVAACALIAAAVSRTNNVDSMLVFLLLLATWLLFRAARRRSIGNLLGAFAVIGVGFNVKMLQAYMVLPSFYLFYLLAFKVKWTRKLGIGIAAAFLLVATSLSWAVVVDSVPANERPYIGSSQTNSVLELALGYNGLSRLTGDRSGGSGVSSLFAGGDAGGQNAPSPGGADGGFRAGAPDGGGQPGFGRGGNGGGGMFNTGTPGVLRLFQSELAGQISWVLPFVSFAAVALLAGIRLRGGLTDKQRESLFWLGWLLPAMAFFSVAGFFHPYYLIMLSPPIAALAGAGAVEMWEQYRSRTGWTSWLLPAAIAGTTLFELVVLRPYAATIGSGWLYAVGIAGFGTALALTAARACFGLARLAAAGSMAALLAAPLYWAATPIIYGGNSMLAEAGPGRVGNGGPPAMQAMANPPAGGKDSQLAYGDGRGLPRDGSGTQDGAPGGQPNGAIGGPLGAPGGAAGGGTGQSVDDALLSYVTAHNTGEKFLFATTSAGTAEAYIIETGKPVMAMGGFSGSDPILTVDKLQQLVEDKAIKYFVLDGGFGGGFGGGRGGGSADVQAWIREHAVQIPSSEWAAGWNGAQASAGAGAVRTTLYEAVL